MGRFDTPTLMDLAIAEDDRRAYAKRKQQEEIATLRARIVELERQCEAWAASDKRLMGLIAERDERITELERERDEAAQVVLKTVAEFVGDPDMLRDIRAAVEGE